MKIEKNYMNKLLLSLLLVFGFSASFVRADVGESILQAMYQTEIAMGQVMGAIISCYFDQSAKPSLCKRVAFLHVNID